MRDAQPKENFSPLRSLFTPEGWWADLSAGISVAGFALPLALALALASDSDPAPAIWALVAGGVLAALFGGTRTGITGPGNSLPVMVAALLHSQGSTGLALAVLGCGVLQLISGWLQWGRLFYWVSAPALAGFAAGIGTLLIVGQLPRALGLPSPDSTHPFAVLAHVGSSLHLSQWEALCISAVSAALCYWLPRLLPRFPTSLLVVAAATAVSTFFHLDIPRVESVPHLGLHFGLSMEGLRHVDLLGVMEGIVTLFVLASLESLSVGQALSSKAGLRFLPSRELVGQGLSNVASALVGGLPVAQGLRRSMMNIRSGARTPRASLFNALFAVLFVTFARQWIALIPAAALAGVLLAVGVRMVNLRQLRRLWVASRSEAAIYVVTFVSIVTVDLLSGVQAGVVVGVTIAAFRLAQVRTRIVQSETSGLRRLEVQGPVTFLSTNNLEPLAEALLDGPSSGIVLDLHGVTDLDSSGAALLLNMGKRWVAAGRGVAWLEAPSATLEQLVRADVDGHLVGRVAQSDDDAEVILNPGKATRPIERLLQGVQRFQTEGWRRRRALFEKLAKSQSPHTLFVSCSDSRVVPTLLTSCSPGELFQVRNVGNVVPPYGLDGAPAEGAAVEFALVRLGVQEIVVCGHSSCGAVMALLGKSPPGSQPLPLVSQWLQARAEHPQPFDARLDVREAAQAHVAQQLENLKTYPVVRERLAAGTLQMHGWYYEIGQGLLEVFDPASGRFVSSAQATRTTLSEGPQVLGDGSSATPVQSPA